MQSNKQGSLQEKFNDFGAVPDARLWNSIESRLDEEEKTRGAAWWWMLGSAAAIILVFSVYRVGYNAGVNDGEKETAVTGIHSEEQNAGPENDPVVAETTGAGTAADKNGQSGLTAETGTHTVQSQAAENHTVPGVEKSNDISVDRDRPDRELQDDPLLFKRVEFPSGHLLKTGDPQHFSLSKMPLTDVVTLASADEPAYTMQPMASMERFTKPGRWLIGFNVTAHRPISVLKGQSDLAIMENDTANSADFNGGVAVNNIQVAPHTVVFRRPVLAEFTVARRFAGRWTAQSGIGLAYSTSTGYFNVPNTAMYAEAAGLETVKTKHLAFHIPLHVTFDFIKRRRLECYSGIGVNNEFAFWSKETAGYNAQSLNSLNDKSSPGSFDLRYATSAQFSLGFRYGINERLKLDFRPNVKRYLQDNKGTWLGASAGLTWLL